jgi:type II secretory pathway component PulK
MKKNNSITNSRALAGRPGKRRGIILPVVLVIFMLLAMLAIGFDFSTRAEINALTAQAEMDQARNCAASGLEKTALYLRQSFDDSSVWYDNATLFCDQPVEQDEQQKVDKTTWRYSIVGYNLDDDENVRFGATDEASKVNINTASEDQLEKLPGITSDIAAAIMDWREEGTTARTGGAKDEYYKSLNQPYRCKQAPFDTIEELLLVKGMTGAILFGEDMNRNGILDPNEDDGKISLPIDNGDGVLDRGLYPYITVYSREPDVTDSDPYQPRINIAEWPVTVLQTMLPKYIDQDIVDFIVKARNAKVKFGSSPALLLGMKITSDDSTVTSPVTEEDLPAIMDYLTTGYHLNSDGFVYGRININTAPKTVLQTIGWLTDTEIEAILSTRSRLDSATKKNIAWLVTQEVLTTEKFKEVACLFTARSYQFMMDALGYRSADSTQARIQALMELRLPRVQYIYWRDLSSFGRAYNIDEFGEKKLVVQQ